MKSPKGRSGGGGNLFLALQLDTSAARDPDPASGLRNPGIAGALARTHGDAAAAAVAHRRSMRSLGEEDSVASNGVDGDAIRERQEHQSQDTDAYEDDYDADGPDRRSDYAVRHIHAQ